MIADREHLSWIHQRLVHVHGENPNWDYMVRLRKIISNMHPTESVPHQVQTFSLQQIELLAGYAENGGESHSPAKE